MVDGSDVSFVLSFTEDMMLSAIEERWDDLIEMQLKQDQMLRDVFSDTSRVFVDQEKLNLFEVQRLNKEILNAAERCKADVAGKLREMQQGKSKVGAYQSL